jgi:TRAP-type uncharacterized transport system substrate-binding protein
VAAAALVLVALWAAIVALRPLPPRGVTMATGPEGGAYDEVGKRYRERLAHHGITLRLLPTMGALENLARLRDPRSGVNVGFLQGGITSEKESPNLESLGTVFYEPLWFFHRGNVWPSTPATSGALLERIGRARLVLLGEATHGGA